ncbi:hypothetical protein AAHA92_11897 [Salvia divinorum]|uniref:Uncharacterized protein n=1 Tax=Salvia divinorum TaxID=28513 RepID=A0ABD1HIX4_SALDI
MATPKSIIAFVFLLAALELARGVEPVYKTSEDPRPQDDGIPTCQKDEDCQLVVVCIDATVRCYEGRCRCIKD